MGTLSGGGTGGGGINGFNCFLRVSSHSRQLCSAAAHMLHASCAATNSSRTKLALLAGMGSGGL